MAIEQQVNVNDLQRLNDAILLTMDCIRRVAPQLAYQQGYQQSAFGPIGLGQAWGQNIGMQPSYPTWQPWTGIQPLFHPLAQTPFHPFQAFGGQPFTPFHVAPIDPSALLYAQQLRNILGVNPVVMGAQVPQAPFGWNVAQTPFNVVGQRSF
jgi:hypothetical protein